MIKILYEHRKIIEEMYNSQVPLSRIAARINVARNTLYKELKRGGVTKPSALYSADLAQENTVIRQIKRCRFHQIKTGLSEHLTMG